MVPGKGCFLTTVVENTSWFLITRVTNLELFYCSCADIQAPQRTPQVPPNPPKDTSSEASKHGWLGKDGPQSKDGEKSMTIQSLKGAMHRGDPHIMMKCWRHHHWKGWKGMFQTKVSQWNIPNCPSKIIPENCLLKMWWMAEVLPNAGLGVLASMPMAKQRTSIQSIVLNGRGAP